MAAWERKLRRRLRNLAGFLRTARATLIFHPDYKPKPNRFSDPERVPHIIDYLLEEGCLRRRQLLRPPPLAMAALARVHPWQYLESLEEPAVVRRCFGQQVAPEFVAHTIAAQRRMAAGTLLAARRALRRGRPPQVNLGGGLHHAGADGGEGFCLFNDIAVAIAGLRAEGFGGRVLVIDLDMHHGNGTRSIFAQDPAVFSFSIHATSWDDSPALASRDVALGNAVDGATFLEALDIHLPEVLAEADPALVFYLAGVDGAADDPLGSWRLDADSLLARDRRVLAATRRLPLVVTLAGGYGDEAWRYTARWLADLLADHDTPIPDALERRLDHFRRLTLGWEREVARKDALDFELSLDDLMGNLDHAPHRGLLLGMYSEHGLECIFERTGVLGKIREQVGVDHCRLEIDVSDLRHTARLLSDDRQADLLLETVLTEDRVSVRGLRLVSLDWLLLQNPRAQPPYPRPLLPGQKHPGLGCGQDILTLLVLLCERRGYDGISFQTMHYHLAWLARSRLLHADPAQEARFRALEEALAGHSLAEAGALLEAGRVRAQPSGESAQWQAARIVLPVSAEARAHFESPDYVGRVAELGKTLRFRVEAQT